MLPGGANSFDIEEYPSKTGRSNLVDPRPFRGIVSKRKKRKGIQTYFIQSQKQSLSAAEVIEIIAISNGSCQDKPEITGQGQLKKDSYYDILAYSCVNRS
jgi:hypothetical protein